MQRAVSEEGFTLLELLIAMTLLVLIVSLMMGALRLASQSVAAGERKTDSLERFRTATAVMDAQIQSQMPLAYEEAGNKVYYFRGDQKTLRMTTSHSIWGGRQGYVIVDYLVRSDEAGKETLYASEQTPGIEGKRETRLFMDASEIYFEYFHQEPTGATTIPGEIGLHVNYGAKKLFFLFPVRARGNMSLVPMTPFSASRESKK